MWRFVADGWLWLAVRRSGEYVDVGSGAVWFGFVGVDEWKSVVMAVVV